MSSVLKKKKNEMRISTKKENPDCLLGFTHYSQENEYLAMNMKSSEAHLKVEGKASKRVNG